MIGPLVDVAWLAERRDDPSMRIADVRSAGSTLLNRALYDLGHIPDSVFFDMEGDLAGPGTGRHPLPDAAGFATLVGSRGIGREHTVVVYDDAAGAAAARLWWMLRSLGHTNVALLDGGLQAWLAAGHATTDGEPGIAEAVFVGSAWTGVVDGDDVADRLGRVTLLDARGADRYRGENETLDPVSGHIPTARSVPFADNLTADGFFRARSELEARYAEFADGEVVAYCGSGVTAAHTLLAMEVAGIEGAKLYPGSWSDWITDPARPQAKGSEPGTP